MTATVTATSMAIGSDERIELAQAIAGLIGKIAQVAVVGRATGEKPAADHLCMYQPGPYNMTATGVVIELHDSCFAPDRATWTQVRELATPFGRWRVCPGIHNGGGDVFAPIDALNKLLAECNPLGLNTDDFLARRVSEYTQLMALRRIGNIDVPAPFGVKNEFDIPGFTLRDCDAMKREWEHRIAPNLATWYAAA